MACCSCRAPAPRGQCVRCVHTAGVPLEAGMAAQDWFGYTSTGASSGASRKRGTMRSGRPAGYGAVGGAPRNIRAPGPRRESPSRGSPRRPPGVFVPSPAAVLGNAYMESHGKASPLRSPRARRSPRGQHRRRRASSPAREHNSDVTEFLAKAGQKASMEQIAWEVQQLNDFLSQAGMSQSSPPPRPGLRGRVHIPPQEPQSPPPPRRHSPLQEGFSAWAEEARSGTERRRYVIEAGVELLESRARRRIQLAAFKTWQVHAAIGHDWRYEQRQLQRQRTLAAQRRRHSLMSAYQRWIGYTAGAHAGASPLAQSRRKRLGPGGRRRVVARKRFGSGVDSSSDDSRDDLQEYWRNQRLLKRLTPAEQRRLRTQFDSSSSDDDEDDQARWARQRGGLSSTSTMRLDDRRSNRASQILMGRDLPGAGGRNRTVTSPTGKRTDKAATNDITSNARVRSSSPRIRSPRSRSRSRSRSQSPRPQTPAGTPLRQFRAAAVARQGSSFAAERDRAWRIMYGNKLSTQKTAGKNDRETAAARMRHRRDASPPVNGKASAPRPTLYDSSSDESLAETLAMSPRSNRKNDTNGWHAMSLDDEQSSRAMKILFTPGGRRAATGVDGSVDLDTPRTALERQRRGLRQKREALRKAQERMPAGMAFS